MTRSALRTTTAIVAMLIALAACQQGPSGTDGIPVQPTAEAAAPADQSGGTSLPPGAVVAPAQGAVNAPQAPATVQGGAAPGAPAGPMVNWRSGVEVNNTVWVEIIDPLSFYRVDQVSLVAPDGQAFPSRDISRNVARSDSFSGGGGGPTVGVGFGSWSGSGWGGGGSGTSTGVGLSFPVGGGGGGGSGSDNATRTVAKFQLADMNAYNQTVANWSVHVRLLDQFGNPSVARFPAPVAIR